MSTIEQRKEDHLELCATADVGFPNCSALWDKVTLVHDALPEVAFDDISLECWLLGKKLQAPIIISAMTGGTPRAGNMDPYLAAVAEELGLGFALGSQRPMLEDSTLSSTYDVRRQAPTTLVLGNLGVCQAREAGPAAVADMVARIGADGLALHLNPAQELVQPGGDWDFRGGIDTIAALQGVHALALGGQGDGLRHRAIGGAQASGAGVEHVDIAGAGGTSWVAVEALRSPGGAPKVLANWGVPSAAAVALLAREGFSTLIASGGVRDGLDAARALALGAHAVGLARPLLKAYWEGGHSAVRDFLIEMISSIRAVMFLTGSSRIDDLRRASRVVEPPLSAWLKLI